jgi:hypothetical protein
MSFLSKVSPPNSPVAFRELGVVLAAVAGDSDRARGRNAFQAAEPAPLTTRFLRRR